MDARAVLYDYLAILARRKWLGLGLFIVVTGLTVVSILRTQPVFQARATFMVMSRDAQALARAQAHAQAVRKVIVTE